MSRSKIEWTDRVWNPVRGCARVSEGCRNCYAERIAARFSQPLVQEPSGEYYGGDPFAGFAKMTREGPRWTGSVELIPEKLTEPLRWRKPSLVFVNSMSDLFHEALPFDAIDCVFAVMALAPQHTFQVLTKRPERMRQFLIGHRLCYEDFVSVASKFVGPDCDVDGVLDGAWGRYHDGLPNLWLGVSVEDQPSADARIPHLLATPAAQRFVSYEPALGPVDFTGWFSAFYCDGGCDIYEGHKHTDEAGIDWLIVGGESGPGARPCDIAWIRSAVEQGKAAGVPVFVKQLGARPYECCGNGACDALGDEPGHCRARGGQCTLELRSRKGSDPSEWPDDLRVREVSS